MNGLAMSFHATGLGPPGWKHTQAPRGLSRFASKTLRVPPKQYLRVGGGDSRSAHQIASELSRRIIDRLYPTKPRVWKPFCSFRSRQNCAVLVRADSARTGCDEEVLSPWPRDGPSHLVCNRLDMSHRVSSQEPRTDLESKGPNRSGHDAHASEERFGRHRFLKLFETEL